MESPGAHFAAASREGELHYTVDSDGTPVWPPQVGLEWRTSTGQGVVYATAVVRPRDGEPRDLSMIVLDEGFRMMSRVEGIDPAAVEIGTRVELAWTEDDPPVPVFRPAASTASTGS
jgi:uncharacterized OB-fold protein